MFQTPVTLKKVKVIKLLRKSVDPKQGYSYGKFEKNWSLHIYLHFCTQVQNRLTAFFQSFLRSSSLKFNIWNSQKRGHERRFVPGILCKQGWHAWQKWNQKNNFPFFNGTEQTSTKELKFKAKNVIPVALILLQRRESANVPHFYLSLHLCSGSPWKFI